ncbi:hypothetical protein KGM_202921 [Danaus plexippus plexippus]|uniref:Uncharacterized protein n=1 Tax=Danaus plexippus plexippus TaxID=278856 RepID=A0A212F3Y5_DANPL|nr:hypothetical protein KGM_202921 [Danaus plexippus plexippus]
MLRCFVRLWAIKHKNDNRHSTGSVLKYSRSFNIPFSYPVPLYQCQQFQMILMTVRGVGGHMNNVHN